MAWTRRQSMGLGVLAAAGASSSITRATQASGWAGLPVMGGRKGYADTPMGQVHYRDFGEGMPILLLHQTPWFSIQYAKVQPLLAAAGFRSIAVDTPGFGFSDLPAEQPSIEGYADTLPYVLETLGVDQAAVAGFHTGASIAAAFAHRHSKRANCLILDGAPLYTEEEREQRLSRPHWDQSPHPDGSHLSKRFEFIRDVITKNTAELESTNWSVLSFFMAGETEHFGHVAAFNYDMAPAIYEMTIPTLIISHTGDSLHFVADRIRKMRPDFTYREFEGGNSGVIYDDPKPWAEVVTEFLRTHASNKSRI